MDIPNERSNHRQPTPKGGGIAVAGVLTAFLLVSSAPGSLCFALLMLAIVSYMDDRKPLPARWRLMVQAAAVMLGMTLLDAPVFLGLLPLPLDRLVTMLLWLWMINLTNFMDGIDGITVAEVIAIGAGILAIVLGLDHLPRSLLIDNGLMVAVVLGFGWWNRHPAKIFLGDVGSIPLGFMLGFFAAHACHPRAMGSSTYIACILSKRCDLYFRLTTIAREGYLAGPFRTWLPARSAKRPATRCGSA